MWSEWQLTTAMNYGTYPNQITVADMEVGIVSINFSLAMRQQGVAQLTLVLEDTNTGGQVALVKLTDASELAQMQAILAAAIAELAAPASPSLSQAAGGSLAAATYYATTTYTTGLGETTASPEASLAVSANNLLSIASPAKSPPATGWNLYVGTASGAETKQNSLPIGIGTAWTLPTTGLVTGGAAPPSTNTTGSGGMTIEQILLGIASNATDPVSGKNILPPGSIVAS
jgi:hypothetical protein